MKKLSTRHIKMLALLSSVRWYNILLTALAQYLSALFVFNTFPESIFLVFFDFKLHIIVFSTLLITAGGFLINDFYDFKHDLLVRPKVTLFQQYISKDLRVRLFVWFTVIGLLLALLANFKIFLYFAVLSFGLWFYSHKLKHIPFVKETTASLLTISCFFSVGLHFFFINNSIIAFGFYFLLLLFTRAIVKGFEEIKGNLVFKNSSLPGVLGDQKTRWIIIISILTQLLYSVFLISYFASEIWTYYIFFAGVILFAVLLSLNKIRQGEFYIINFVFKILIVLGILNLIFL